MTRSRPLFTNKQGLMAFVTLVLVTLLSLIYFRSNKYSSTTQNSLPSISSQPTVTQDPKTCQFEDAAEKTTPSVVKVLGENKMGTGFIVTSDGFIVTNYHVVQDESNLHIVLSDETSIPAQLHAYDQLADIALIKVNTDKSLIPVTWGSVSDLKPGVDVMAIGFPYSDVLKGNPTLSKGVYAALRVSEDDAVEYIQTDAAINPGNSGGPLIDKCGKVLGINVMSLGGNGLNFAISERTAQTYIASLIKQTATVTKDIPAMNRKDQLSPEAVVWLYYADISVGQLDKAYELLSREKRAMQSLDDWKKGYKNTLNVYLHEYYEVESNEDGFSAVFVNFTSADLVDGKVKFQEYEGVWHVMTEDGETRLDHGPILKKN